MLITIYVCYELFPTKILSSFVKQDSAVKYCEHYHKTTGDYCFYAESDIFLARWLING